MILNGQIFKVKISNNGAYYRSVGYSLDETKQRKTITVPLEKLPKEANRKVWCQCETCPAIFQRSWQVLNLAKSNVHLCRECSSQRVFETRDYTKIKSVAASRTSVLHPKFNPNKPAFKEYQQKVFSLTRKNDLSVLENFDKPRGLCGVNGAYQLDHIVSIKHGFDNSIEPEILADISNLRFISWEENRKKWATVPK